MAVRERLLLQSRQRWHFEQHGTPLPEEDLQRYSARQNRDRLNEEGMMALLERIGIHPWRESTYDFSHDCFRSTSLSNSPANKVFAFRQVQEKAGGPPPPDEDEELVGPPDYLHGKVKEGRTDGPARLLIDGKWCGHGEKMYWLYDIQTPDCRDFIVRLPEPGDLPVVMAASPETNGRSRSTIAAAIHSVFVDGKPSHGASTRAMSRVRFDDFPGFGRFRGSRRCLICRTTRPGSPLLWSACNAASPNRIR